MERERRIPVSRIPASRLDEGAGLSLLLAAVLALLAGSPGSLWAAQAEVDSGTIRGTVSDASGAVVPGVEVTAFAPGTGFDRLVVSDATGRYAFLSLAPDTYEIEFRHPDFAVELRRPIDVRVGQEVRIDSMLVLPETELEIIVVAEAPIVETARTQQADTITEFRVDNLPINRRDFLDFTLLAPGVTDANALVSFGLPITPDSGLSFAGQSPRSNSVTVDGLDHNDNSTGSVRATLSQDAVREFQINRSNFGAESGGASGGVINIVTKSGTNDSHFGLFSFLRDHALDARNPFAFGADGEDIDPPFRRWQSGFTIGGPIRENQTFYFISYEGLYQRESVFTTFLENRDIFQPTAEQQEMLDVLGTSADAGVRLLGAQVRGALTTAPETFPRTIARLEAESGVFPFRNNANTASARVDHRVGQSGQLFVRAGFSDVDTVGGAFGGLKGPSRGTDYAIQDASVAAGYTHFLSPTTVNELRFQFADRDYIARSPDPFGPEISISGTALVGRDLYLPLSRKERRFQLVDGVTRIIGNHELRFGGDYNRIAASGFLEIFFGGRFVFGEGIPLVLALPGIAGPDAASRINAALLDLGRPDLAQPLVDFITPLQAYNLGLPLIYAQGFGESRADQLNNTVAGYVEDRYRVASNLTLTLGVRYDVELQDEPVHRDTNNIAPRFGFAYAPAERTVIRGGYGVHYARVFQALTYIERVLSGDLDQITVPLVSVSVSLPANAAEVWGYLNQTGVIGQRTITPADIAPLGLIPGTTPPVRYRTSPGLMNPYSQQASFGIEQGFGTDWSASVDYLLNRGVKLLRSRNWNLVALDSNTGFGFGAPDPTILQDNVVESSGSSIYHGMTVTVRKRLSGFHQLNASYTLSKAIDDTTDFIAELQPANQLDLAAERSLSSFDQRHRFVFSGTIVSPFQPGLGAGRILADLSVSPIVTVGSGRPFNLLVGYDQNGDTNPSTDRPLGAGRNTGTGPGYFSVDLRVAKGFEIGDRVRIEAVVEGFNLLNRVNYSGVNDVVGRVPLDAFDVEGDPENSPTEFGGFTSAYPARQLQVGLRVDF